jgi:acyl-CoA thioesterase-2
MPDVPPPEQLTNELELIRGIADKIPESLRKIITQDRPIDFRPVSPNDPFHPEKREPVRHMWLRGKDRCPTTHSSIRPCSRTRPTTAC